MVVLKKEWTGVDVCVEKRLDGCGRLSKSLDCGWLCKKRMDGCRRSSTKVWTDADGPVQQESTVAYGFVNKDWTVVNGCVKKNGQMRTVV